MCMIRIAALRLESNHVLAIQAAQFNHIVFAQPRHQARMRQA